MIKPFKKILFAVSVLSGFFGFANNAFATPCTDVGFAQGTICLQRNSSGNVITGDRNLIGIKYAAACDLPNAKCEFKDCAVGWPDANCQCAPIPISSYTCMPVCTDQCTSDVSCTISNGTGIKRCVLNPTTGCKEQYGCSVSSCNTCYKESGNSCVLKGCGANCTLNTGNCTCSGSCPGGSSDSTGSYNWNGSGSCDAPS